MTEPRAADLIAARHSLITRRLRRRRDDLGLTQKQIVTRLARCGMQTTNRALSSLEHGSGLDVAKLPELAVALDCTVTYLIGLTDDPHRWEPDEPLALPPGTTAAATPVLPSAPVRSTAPVPTWPAGARAESLILGTFLPAASPSRDRPR